ncbi:hypothetical protein M8J75_011389 [Diaphorina citri]|nr:hypothetical protein M8J75_011389 [Diaphorina citri]
MKCIQQTFNCQKLVQVNRICQMKINTWSSLATTFNSKPATKFPLKLRRDSGLFGIPELQSYEGFYALKEKTVSSTDELLKECCDINRRRKLVEVFDDLSNELCCVADMAEFIRIAHPQSAYAFAAEDACISVSGIVEKLNTHKELYNMLHQVVHNGDNFSETEVDKHVASLFLFDFEQNGIHLSESERTMVVKLNDYILQTGQKFMNGTVTPRTVDKQTVPTDIVHAFSPQGGHIVVNGLYGDSSDSKVREMAYKLYMSPDDSQEYLLLQLLDARKNLAKICGFKTYAHRAIKASTAETPTVVSNFLNKLSDELFPRAEKDFHIMSQIKEKLYPGEKLQLWDIAYVSNKAKRDKLKLTGIDFAPYFSLGTCMEGLNNLFNKIYGITLQHVEANNGELWSSDVYKLAVTHEKEGLLGYIYCDFFERQKKPNQDCHFTIRGGRKLSNGSYQNPIVVLMLNLPTPRWSSPCLLTPAMVDNLFHEMGHAMHSMLARTDYQHVTGTRCATDFAEVPSVLMEFFASDPRVIKSFAKHYIGGQPMPEEMLQSFCLSKKLFQASEMQAQVFYSALDLEYHSSEVTNTFQQLKECQNTYYGIPYIEHTAWQHRFSHLVGYGAKYYSYLLSRAVASWIWQSYFEKDPFSRDSGDAYRLNCLSHGGGKPASKLVSDFLQKDITAESLTNSLMQELDKSSYEQNTTLKT